MLLFAPNIEVGRVFGMTQELNDIGPLIQEIKTLAVTDKVKIGAVAILNIIKPVA